MAQQVGPYSLKVWFKSELGFLSVEFDMFSQVPLCAPVSSHLPNMTLGGLVILNGPCENVVACDGLLFQSLIPELAPP